MLEGNYTNAAISIILSRVRILPNVTNRKLKNMVNDLFRDVPANRRFGSGSAMDAHRHEVITGNPIGGKFHKEKLENYQRGLEKLLRNPQAALNEFDTKAAQAIL